MSSGFRVQCGERHLFFGIALNAKADQAAATQLNFTNRAQSFDETVCAQQKKVDGDAFKAFKDVRTVASEGGCFVARTLVHT
jgi:hypothetical protein